VLSADEEATLEELEERIEACRTQLEYKVSEISEQYICIYTYIYIIYIYIYIYIDIYIYI
jgi:hypothetical protein